MHQHRTVIFIIDFNMLTMNSPIRNWWRPRLHTAHMSMVDCEQKIIFSQVENQLFRSVCSGVFLSTYAFLLQEHKSQGSLNDFCSGMSMEFVMTHDIRNGRTFFHVVLTKVLQYGMYDAKNLAK